MQKTKKVTLSLFVYLLLHSAVSEGLAYGSGKAASVAPSIDMPASSSSVGDVVRKKSIEVAVAKKTVEDWCSEVNQAIVKLKWKIDPCTDLKWQTAGSSLNGRPLVFMEFGNQKAENTTLIFSTVHGDEITPLYIGLQLVHWLKERKDQLVKTRVIIAPLVNPDGFFSEPRTRMNARGVDVNRNFPTHDWPKLALANWKKKYRSDPRRFPGNVPLSEPETLFQDELIRKFHPQKILSIHSPLNFLDYDGPSTLLLAKFPTEYAQSLEKLKKRLKAISSGFFPGSLGNYAGRELGIPTLTLELPSADPKQAEKYWKQFSQGIHTMIQFSVPNYATSTLQGRPGS